MRFILGVLIAGAALFMWGFVYWTISPFSKSVIQTFETGTEEALATSLKTHIGKSGVFVAPKPPEDFSDVPGVEAFGERHRQGPVYMLFYHQDGLEPMSMSTLVYGFLHAVLIALVAGLVLVAAGPPRYLNRVMLIFWIAVFGSVWADLGNVLWWHHPWNFCCLQMGYHMVGGLIIGVILAGLVRPDSPVG